MTTNHLGPEGMLKKYRKRCYARQYYQDNKDKAKAYSKANRNVIKARAAAWRLANRDRYLKQQADYDRNRRLRGLRFDTNSAVGRMVRDARTTIKFSKPTTKG